MTRTVALLATLAVVGMLFAVPATGQSPPTRAADGHAASQATPANETAEAVAPGAQLAGIVAVQGVEVRGELAQRNFGHQIASARSNASKEAIVAERVRELQAETATLQERRRELVEARGNGTISQARFRAEMAALAARSGTLVAQADRTQAVAAGLDQDRLAERGVNATAIGRLRTEARNATGPEAAEIARSIAGNDVGRGLSGQVGEGPGGPFDVPPGRNETTEDGVTITLDAETPPGNGTDPRETGGPVGDAPENTTGGGSTVPEPPDGPPEGVPP